ncbi:MAG: hypothetical protein MJZ13_04475 [Bacteroidales bacterium]|nr:hypothetical protein [Bacteroidales bacterium]
MTLNNLSLYNDDFENKLKELRKRFRSRMNGKTTEQMENGQITYAENYGASLQHVKELASEISFSPEEYRKLWLTNIREAMLISAINFPDNLASAEEMMSWSKAITTADMAEQGSFFLFYRCNEINLFLHNLISEHSCYAMTIATFTAGRVLIKGKNLSDDTCRIIVESLQNAHHLTSSEARGASLFLRQLCDKGLLTEMAKKTADIFSSRPKPLFQQIAFEVYNELQMN